jgi:serine phosphatase RsbU (regulator of sigma subunit)
MALADAVTLKDSQPRNLNGQRAFVQALQRSEAHRAYLLLAVLFCLILLATLRFITGGLAMRSAAYPARLVVLGAAALYVAAIILVVRRADAANRLLAPSFWIGTAVVESVIPTLNIISLLMFAPIEPLEAIVAPAMIVYFLFTIIGVLRLRPSLSLLSAGLSALQHAALVVWTIRENNGMALYPYYLGYSALVLIGGACAAMVSREIRKHVQAGLRELETRAELADVRKSLEIARDIQQSLLPREELRLKGFDVAAWNRPADETGGDYYDWIQLPDGRVAVVIADVTGHGIGPALLMAVCRAYARASVPAVNPLRTAIEHLNTLVSQDFGNGRFVTLAVAIVSPDHGDIELLSAGHGPTLVYRRDGGTVEMFEGDGLPLGIVPDEQFVEPRRISMAQGDVLLLSTDGFMEAPGDGGELFGISRLSASLAAHADRPTAQVLACLDKDIRDFSGSNPQTDDMTAVIIRRSE